MGWHIHTVTQSKAGSDVLFLLYNGRSRLIAVISPNPSAVESLEGLIISAFDDSQTGGRNDQREKGRSMIVEAVESAEEKGFFIKEDLRSDSVLYIRTRDGAIQAEHVHEADSYLVYCSMLQPPNKIVKSEEEEGGDIALKNRIVAYGKVIYDNPLASWRMTCTRASVASSPGEKFVYKGVSFYQFLVGGPEHFVHDVEACYREIRMINHIISPHPNVMPPAKYLVYADSGQGGDGSEHRICGSLYVYCEKGSLADVLNKTTVERIRLPLSLKARWCFQLCSAMAHVHFKAGSYHQDLKPPNIIVDDDQNLLIADWEQSGANPFILAPEAEGEYDVELGDDVNGRTQLVYTRYEGPTRTHHAFCGTINVFPEWHQSCPRATEIAEVYSLGRTMWILLEQVGLEHRPGVSDYSTTMVEWSSWSEDLPASWKHKVEASFARDPNARPLMSKLLDFWEKEWQRFR
ncbi:hypothetical protein PT974_09768 [Cladobotryum mycophilum]|uniref:Protein kinase domain-containing protein n=1 Tax=Cladobotryum mycophilum TaxID=491253 RepID=A0ABR0SIA5_9HYPO